ncbi:hypothetical protein BFP72_04695 [Reichenbachiella sp. 5M10]|uniref:hypothetical protein n=1 Tax=Reichenbachiella sp. 5M10 TaxID=1889772 RepID=UPI000C15D086|nr:hypothetical protein [Reichenbachiella sp. 5M10]PIB34753.1 hypothetical protein BFP72_04695 [Reichenbachiella sp. 5M10]
MLNISYFKTVFFNDREWETTTVDTTLSEYPQFKRDLKRFSETNDQLNLRVLVQQWQHTAQLLNQDDLWYLLEQFQTSEEMTSADLDRWTHLVLNELEIIIGEFQFCRIAS